MIASNIYPENHAQIYGILILLRTIRSSFINPKMKINSSY